MYFLISMLVLIAKVESMENQPIRIVDRLCHPPGARMVPECPLLGPVGGAVCLGKGSVPMPPPLGCHDGKHLAALKRHLDHMLIRQADRRCLWVRRSYEDVHRQKIGEGTLVPILYTEMGFQTGFL